MKMSALTFVHGINNGPSSKQPILRDLRSKMAQHGVGSLFMNPPDPEPSIQLAAWDSVGDFFLDIVALCNPEWRQKAIQDIQETILAVQDRLIIQGSHQPVSSLRHVLLLHSMGQPLGISALQELTVRGRILIPTSVVSIGGPLGSRNPVFKTYLQWCTAGISWWKPSSSMKIDAWVDIWNPDDPVCHDPTISLLRPGYSPCRGVTESLRFDWADHPDAAHPLAEHSSYLEGDLLYSVIRKLVSGSKP